jgi:hypothetical protein
VLGGQSAYLQPVRGDDLNAGTICFQCLAQAGRLRGPHHDSLPGTGEELADRGVGDQPPAVDDDDLIRPLAYPACRTSPGASCLVRTCPLAVPPP